jgi:hypothetical protein
MPSQTTIPRPGDPPIPPEPLPPCAGRRGVTTPCKATGAWRWPRWSNGYREVNSVTNFIALLFRLKRQLPLGAFAVAFNSDTLLERGATSSPTAWRPKSRKNPAYSA